MRRTKVRGTVAVYHCMTRVVNGEMLLRGRAKEILRKMLWQVADFSGVEVLTYCVMSNHFHVLVRVPEAKAVSDAELMRRYRVLYPKPTQYQTATAAVMKQQLQDGGAEAVAIRTQLLARMGDISEYMKAVKQRFSVWYNRNHGRYGTLWANRFKSVLVEGKGNSLQTVAAYIDLNPVRAGLVKDPKDYRFCGYAEAVAGLSRARAGLLAIWGDHAKRRAGGIDVQAALQAHRLLIFGKGSSPWIHKGKVINRKAALRVLEQESGRLPRGVALRCRVRYFTDGAILGSTEFVRGFFVDWQMRRGLRRRPKVNVMAGCDWGDLAVIHPLRRDVFS
ncbi:transposase [Coraliomargarita parva]|uniref:transposase n=1 Tax=Coraliomargarita parva TaxID=3014050 RepID=UPI0022B55E00|nr:transposase [Coraliomargarita parva]